MGYLCPSVSYKCVLIAFYMLNVKVPFYACKAGQRWVQLCRLNTGFHSQVFYMNKSFVANAFT